MHTKQKILIVDDNPNNIKLVADSLKLLNVSIIFATSGYKAIELNSEQDIDLILMDINMPGMDGFETVEKMQTSTPVIYVTALNDKVNILKAFNHGGVDYITKPFYPEELIARVTTHLNLVKLNQNLTLEVQEKTKQLMQKMFIDDTTGAYNASQLYIDLLNNSQSTGAMFHIKNIENYEIVFGLENVEKLLFKFTQWLKEQAKYNLTIYHTSHSDFICLFDIDDIDKIEYWCMSIMEKLQSAIFEITDDSPIHINYIITLAQAEGKKLIQNLKIAQQEANTKNVDYYFYEEKGMQIIEQQSKNLYWLEFLKQSFENDNIVPFFQPIVETHTGKIIKYECLARIKDGDKIISPYFFIDAAKQIGAITKITKIMIKKSCKVFQNSKLGLSINITKDDLIEGYLVNLLLEMTQKYNLKKEQITLEVLEEISVFGSDDIINQLLILKNEGYKIALDDFGSENASFARMLDLKVDIIKIDGMFIKNIVNHKNSKLIVQSIVHLAKLFDYEVVAEFVHNSDVALMIDELGISYSQGYYYSEPVELPHEI